MQRVLIIEDEPAYQHMLQSAFEKENFEVIVKALGKQGIFEIKDHRPDIILLDIMLPGGTNGFDFLEELEANPQTKNIPVIIITNLDSEENVAKKIGAAFYFIKSQTTVEQIVAKTKQLLSS